MKSFTEKRKSMHCHTVKKFSCLLSRCFFDTEIQKICYISRVKIRLMLDVPNALACEVLNLTLGNRADFYNFFLFAVCKKFILLLLLKPFPYVVDHVLKSVLNIYPYKSQPLPLLLLVYQLQQWYLLCRHLLVLGQ